MSSIPFHIRRDTQFFTKGQAIAIPGNTILYCDLDDENERNLALSQGDSLVKTHEGGKDRELSAKEISDLIGGLVKEGAVHVEESKGGITASVINGISAKQTRGKASKAKPAPKEAKSEEKKEPSSVKKIINAVTGKSEEKVSNE